MLEYDQAEQAEMPDAGNFSVKIIGVGGAGANVLDRMTLNGTEDADMLTLNTDIRALSTSVSNNKIQLGKDLLKGMGAGGDPELGRQAALEVEDQIRAAVRGHNMVFVCAGLGGGTGSGAAPEVCRIANEEGVFLVAFTTLPFTFEGARRMQQAKDALGRIGEHANAVVTFENDRMGSLTLDKDGIQSAFQAADDTISESVRATTNIVTQPGIIRIGMDDLLSALRNRDSRCLFGHGQAKGDNRALEALKNALKSPLIDKGKLLEQTRNVLVHVSGGDNLTLFEVDLLMKELNKHVGENTQLMFGVGTDKKLGSSLAVTIITSLSEQAPQTAESTPDQDDPEKKKIALRSEEAGEADGESDADPVDDSASEEDQEVAEDSPIESESEAEAEAEAEDAGSTAVAAAAVISSAGASTLAGASVIGAAVAAAAATPEAGPEVDEELAADEPSEEAVLESEEEIEAEAAEAAVEEETEEAGEDVSGESVDEVEVEPSPDIDEAPEAAEESETEPESEGSDKTEISAEQSEVEQEDATEVGVSDESEAAAEGETEAEPELVSESEASVEDVVPAAESDDIPEEAEVPEEEPTDAEAEAIKEEEAEVEAEIEPEPEPLPPVVAPPAELLQALAPETEDESIDVEDTLLAQGELRQDSPLAPVSEAADLASLDELDDSVEASEDGDRTKDKKVVAAETKTEAIVTSEEEADADNDEAADDGIDPSTGLGWSGLKTSGTIGALLREGRTSVAGDEDEDDEDDEDDVDEAASAEVTPPVSSPFEIGDDDDDDIEGELPIAETVETSADTPKGPAIPPWLTASSDDDGGDEDSPALNPIAEAVQKGSETDTDEGNAATAEPRHNDGGGTSKPMMSIRDLANANREVAESNELEFAGASDDGKSDPPPGGAGITEESAADGDTPGEVQSEIDPPHQAASPLEPLGLDEVVVAGADAASTIRLTRLTDPLETRAETTPIAPLDSLPPDNDATKPILTPPADDAAPLESLEEPPHAPVNVSPLSPPPGLKPAADASAAAAAAKAKADQAMLNLEPTSKGRFAKSEPTIVDGQDLDIPTLLRTTKKS